MSENNKALLKRWFEEVWNKGRADAVEEMFAADGIAHGLSDDAGVRGRHSGDSLGFAATYAPVEFSGISIIRVKDGQIVEGWNNFDFMKMNRQLGVL